MRLSFQHALAWSIAVLGPATLAQAQFSQPQSPPAQQTSPPAAPAQQQATPAKDVVATVNGEAITKPEFDSALQAQLKQVNQADPEAARKAPKQVLDSLVESRLVEQYMVTKGPDVPKEEVTSTINRFKQQLQGQGVPFEQFLQTRGYSESTLEKRIAGSLAWQKFQQQQVTEEKLQAHFDANQSQFPTDDFEKAKPLVAQALVGELWTGIVKETKPQAKIEIVQPQAVQPKQPQKSPAPIGGGGTVPGTPQ